ncbi:MAG: hypothetical protein ACI89U_001856, partial [Gammaproteobacteria bacterium]
VKGNTVEISFFSNFKEVAPTDVIKTIIHQLSN